MPFIHVTSNVASTGIDTDAALRAFTKDLSETLEVSEQFVMAQLNLGVPMAFQGGNTAPCAFVHIRCIGKIDAEWNPKTVEVLTATVTKTIGVPGDRVFVNLVDVPMTNWGMNGKLVQL